MLARTPEPELMNDEDQVQAYADADFAEAHNSLLVHLKKHLPAGQKIERILDLGSGSGDMTYRLHCLFPSAALHAVDGSPRMIEAARRFFAQIAMGGGAPLPVQWSCTTIQDMPAQSYDLVFSNSLLHHIHDPSVFWKAIAGAVAPGSYVFVSDLLRPASEEEAREIVEKHSGNEADILKHDFYHSLLAAFRPDEVGAQLKAAGLPLSIEIVSDRHQIIYGRV